MTCLIGSAAMARVASNVPTPEMERFAYMSYGFAIASFIWVLGFILASEDAIGAIFIIVSGAALWLYYIRLSRRGRLHSQNQTDDESPSGKSAPEQKP